MGTPDFDERIGAAEAEADTASAQMGVEQRAALDATAVAAASWWESQVERAISQRPEAALALSTSGRLGTIKRQLAELKANAPELVDKHLGRAELWSVGIEESLKSQDERYVNLPYRGSERKIPGVIENDLRNLLGEVAPILVDSGLAEATEWRRQGNRIGSVSASYPYAIPWSDDVFSELREALDRFSEAYNTYVLARRRSLQTSHEKAQAEAADLWRNA